MPLFSATKRKTHRSLSPPSNGHDTAPARSGGRRSRTSGMSGIFSRSAAKQQPSLLPTTTTTTSPSDQYQSSVRRRAHHSSPSNNFLLGGQFYPGKDKKRRWMRKHHKTLWWRIFWSSPARMAFTCLLMSSIVVWYVLMPMASVVWRMVPSSRYRDSTWFLHETTLALASRSDERTHVQQLELVRDELLDNREVQQERLHILEQIAPEWFHRNDPKPPQQEKVTESRPDERDTITLDEEDEEDRGEEPIKEDEEEPVSEKQVPKVNTRDDTVPKERPPTVKHVLSATEDKAPSLKNDTTSVVADPSKNLRTLQTMHLFANHTSCPAKLTATDISTTLVIQATLDRLWVLDETCTRWSAPIVAVVVLTDEQYNAGEANALAGWRDECPQLQLILHKMEPYQEAPEQYPVNHVRNVGLDAVTTSHVLIVDVDFVPSLHLDQVIRRTLEQQIGLRTHKTDLAVDEKEALVVPAFERVLSIPCTTEAECKNHLRQNSSFIPHTFDALKECVVAKDCIVFQSDVNWEGHHSTRTQAWLNRQWYEDATVNQSATALQNIRTLKCFDSFRYEPYVVIRWCPAGQTKPEPIAPYYDERFHGYGKNKIEYISHLRFLGYQFAVLPEGFIVHNPHLESKAKQKWNNMQESDLHANMDQLYPAFLQELYDKYYDNVKSQKVVDLCRDEEIQ